MIKPYATLLDQAIQEKGFLIFAHRGLSQGDIVENTIASMRASFRAGADAVEMDVVKSIDGDFFVFHDGCEARLFGTETRNLLTLSTAEINALRYRNNIGLQTEAKVETLADFLNALPADKLMNMDRSWAHFATLLPYLDGFSIETRLLLKAPSQAVHLDTMARHEKKYMFLAICCDLADVERALTYQDTLNLVGLELLAGSDDHPFMQSDYVRQLKKKGLHVLVNSLNLGREQSGETNVLWGSFDDNVSVVESPEKGWGDIIAQGADMIDTDWPALLANYRQTLG